jgi:glycosyltransferase involved in cell wall biosynthesis
MSNRSKHHKRHNQAGSRLSAACQVQANTELAYQQASLLAEEGRTDEARSAYQAILEGSLPARWRALIENDLGALDGLLGDLTCARIQFERALAIDARCEAASQNLELVMAWREPEPPANLPVPPPQGTALENPRPIRIAILSLLFNWPSTGGGTVHTAELAEFLTRAGYDVTHVYAQCDEWGIGNVTKPLAARSEPLRFDRVHWNAPEIQRQFRQAVDRFVPDYVIITDSWNFKPLLAEAVRGYRYYLRLAALECLCPLNNVRLLIDSEGQATACPRHQFATPHLCADCVLRRHDLSGSLHEAERALSGYGTPEFDQKLRQAFADAAGVLAVNPLIAAMVQPYCSAVHVVPSGFDPRRFPWPWPEESRAPGERPVTLFFAGLVEEFMKGFHVLHAACQKLWLRRRDFQLLATGSPPASGQRYTADGFVRFIGWQSQAELPSQIRKADILVFPTVAEEALGRSAVEAMGVGRPVIASRIGGLPFTVIDGTTGLLFDPGDVDDLAEKIERLLNDASLRERMGVAGRRRFEEFFTWDAIIARHYRRLLAVPDRVNHMA